MDIRWESEVIIKIIGDNKRNGESNLFKQNCYYVFQSILKCKEVLMYNVSLFDRCVLNFSVIHSMNVNIDRMIMQLLFLYNEIFKYKISK